MKTGIYMIRNKINNKAYIGQAQDIDVRWATHINELNNNKHSNQYLQNSWNKYGADNFEFTIICLCEEEELNDFEIDMISHYHTFYKDGNGGYNLTFGGEGTRGYRFTDEQRAKVSERTKEAMNRPEVKAKLSEAMKEAMKGKPKSEETRAKLSEAMKGDKNPAKRPEVKAKLSEAMKGDKNPMKRPEVKAKMSESMKEAMKGKNAKAVYCVTNDTIYESSKGAEKELGVERSNISRCCNGKYITKRYPDGHHIKGLELWFLSEYEEKFGKVAL